MCLYEHGREAISVIVFQKSDQFAIGTGFQLSHHFIMFLYIVLVPGLIHFVLAGCFRLPTGISFTLSDTGKAKLLAFRETF
jgi:hypothetical protein